MLISRVSDEEGLAQEGEGSADQEDHSHDYQTANELFDFMAKSHNFQPGSEDETLTTRDLVILYKNIDLGTKLMSSANEFKRKAPNQYVETVVYNEDPESDSELSEIYSSEDLHNVVLINKERIDLLTNPSSLENSLCPKIGDLDIQTSDLGFEYNRQFLFKDPYINEQFKSMKLVGGSDEFIGTALPVSLLDYICCKRLEDNYNFYMDNIITYVKHTIEQLKRISNGDYLTDKAKQKWREVEHNEKNIEKNNDTTILETSTSIPLHVERKVSGHPSTWDDIVHSEVDIRYLSKILEKKIFFEVPKMICGSYRLFSKCCNDNLIISCKKKKYSATSEESRVDVVFKLQRSESGNVMSHISSIMMLQKSCSQQETCASGALTYNEKNAVNNDVEIIKENTLAIDINEEDKNETKSENIIEYNFDSESSENNESFAIFSHSNEGFTRLSPRDMYDYNQMQINECERSISDYVISDENDVLLKTPIKMLSTASSTDGLREVFFKKRNSRAEASFNIIPADELRLTMQRLNIQSSLPEEGTEDISVSTGLKRRSPQRNRIKSPYENKSFALEDKKRRKLLEIRERREKKKIAMSEHCKVTKSKYVKATIMPQTSNSVTKLSITNKSFYNSIYGQTLNINIDNKQPKMKGRKEGRKDTKFSSEISRLEDDPLLSSERRMNSQKYINRSYFLDEAVTEMYLQKQKTGESKDNFSDASAVSNFSTNLKILTQFISPSCTSEINAKESANPLEPLEKLDETVSTSDRNDGHMQNLVVSQSNSDVMVAPDNTPNIQSLAHCEKEYSQNTCTSSTSVEFRKSIDKIYDLMKKIGKTDGNESKLVKSKFTTSAHGEKVHVVGARRSSSVQGSDSGTSLKHHLASSSPSYLSLEKVNTDSKNSMGLNRKNPAVSVLPKVIISAKTQNVKGDEEKIKPHRKKLSNVEVDNPLKAISQLLHEFDNVQKNRHKSGSEMKSDKKPQTNTDVPIKPGSRQTSYKRNFRSEQQLRDNEPPVDRLAKPKEKKPRPGHVIDKPKNYFEERNFNRAAKRPVVDIVDEFKEARGEAVRGPSKLNSRLNSLAQPKKMYVQAHIEEFQMRYGRNPGADRPQRHAVTPSPQIPDRTRPGFANLRKKMKRNGADAAPLIPGKQSVVPSQPLDRAGKPRHPSVTYPVATTASSAVNDPSCKQTNVTEKPVLKKKMVAVEAYLKNHYGHTPSPSSPSRLKSVLEGLTSRVPLIPQDIGIGSPSIGSSPTAEESSAIGTKLHLIIDSMINNNLTPTLSSVAEVNESSSKITKNIEGIPTSYHTVSKDCVSADFDFRDIFGDQPTEENSPMQLDKKKAVKSINEHDFDCHDIFGERPTENNFPTQIDDEKNDINSKEQEEPLNTAVASELEKLENALHRRLSVSTFQKRLRIKNLTLTPKQSTQQVFVLQSGDVGSLVLKSTLSQNFKISKNNAETTSDLTKLSKTNLDWDFPQIPMQFTTVGYAFPLLHSVSKRTTNIHIGARQEQTLVNNDLTTPNKIKSFDAAQPGSLRESAAQVDLKEFVTITNVFGINPVVAIDNAVMTKITKEQLKQTAPNERITYESINHTIIQNISEKFGSNDKKQTVVTSSNNEQRLSEKNRLSENKQIIKPLCTTEGVPYKLRPNEKKRIELLRSTKIMIPEKDRLFETEQQPTWPNRLENQLVQEKDNLNDTKTFKPSYEVKEVNTDCENAPSDKSECVEYTTSLDILAGLLNEIQKITTCQTEIANSQTTCATDVQCKQLVTTSIDGGDFGNAMQNSARDIISITSLDRLRQLESSHSIISFYISNDGDKRLDDNKTELMSDILNVNHMTLQYHLPVYADKEVNVDISEKKFVNRYTDIPLQISPITVNHATNVSNSLIGVLSQPSTQSMYSFPDQSTYFDSPLVTRKKIIELPRDTITSEDRQTQVHIQDTKEQINNNEQKVKKIMSNSENTATAIKQVNFTERALLDLKLLNKFTNKKDQAPVDLKQTNTFTDNNEKVATDINNLTKIKRRKLVVKKIENPSKNSDGDPLMKMKRDVLVTVYSILVFTVFAALSFPELLYHSGT